MHAPAPRSAHITYETGWRAISLYTGVPVGELRAARLPGTAAEPPIVTHRVMDEWLLHRSLTSPEFRDHLVEFAAHLQELAERAAADDGRLRDVS